MIDLPDKDLFEDESPAPWRLLGAWCFFPFFVWILWWEVSGWESVGDLPARLVAGPFGAWLLFGLFAAVCIWIVVKVSENSERLPTGRFQRATMLVIFLSLCAVVGILGYGAWKADQILEMERYGS